MKAVVHCDMVGGNFAITKSVLQEKVAQIDEETKKLVDKALKVALSL